MNSGQKKFTELTLFATPYGVAPHLEERRHYAWHRAPASVEPRGPGPDSAAPCSVAPHCVVRRRCAWRRTLGLVPARRQPSPDPSHSSPRTEHTWRLGFVAAGDSPLKKSTDLSKLAKDLPPNPSPRYLLSFPSENPLLFVSF